MSGASTTRWALLAVTLLGTLSNYIIVLPVRTIAADLDSTLPSAVLAVGIFAFALAVCLPLSGWLGDRFGHRRVIIVALVVMAGAQIGAALSPNMPALIGLRALQGGACSVFPPTVMGLLMGQFPTQRARVMGAWAAANGAGQALGPTLGGFLADTAGWRMAFWVLAGLSVLLALGIALFVPATQGQYTRFDLVGTLLVMAGTAGLLGAANLVSQGSGPDWLALGLAIAGVLLWAAFAYNASRAKEPLIRPRLLVDGGYLWTTLTAFAQMFTLALLLFVIPLTLTGSLGLSTWVSGLFILPLPLTMALLAPFIGNKAEGRPVRYLRAGLGTLVVSNIGLLVVGRVLDQVATDLAIGLLAAVILVSAVGMACVQSPAASLVGSTPAGAIGAGLGLYITVRFAGSAVGAAWVALTYPKGLVVAVLGSVILLVVALAGVVHTFRKPNHNPSP